MANTVTLLSYANTFSDWLVKTNALAVENNNLAANNYYKNTGTLYLNEPTLGLQVYNNAFVGGQTETSTLRVDNNASVNGTLYITNTVLSIVASGQANIGGVLLAQGSGTGLSVANNALIGGSLTANSVVNLGTTNIYGITTVSNNITVVGTTNLYGLNITGTTSVSNNIFSTSTIQTTGSLVSNLVQANTSVNTASVYATNLTGTNIVANTSVVSPFVSSGNIVNSGTVTTNILTANTQIIVPSLNVGNQIVNSSGATLNSVTTGSLTVTGAFVLSGTTTYSSNQFIVNSGAPAQNSSFQIYRGGATPANLRWNEGGKYWDINDVTSNVFYKVVTTEYLSSSTSTNDNTIPASAAAIYTVYNLAQPASVQANAAFIQANAAFTKANTMPSTFVGTAGSAAPNNSVISLNSTNGITIAGSSNTLTINTPQDLRTSAGPTFASLTLSSALAINQGGTGATSQGQALTNLLPTGTTAGYVLTTGGAGSFYWAAQSGGGGGATPGTSITSSYLTYTGNGVQTLYTTPSYVPGADQLKMYIDGVRQFPSTYTETSNTSVTFNTAPPNGSVVFVEVDGYFNNPYYANNITYTINNNISPTANTIQLAIDGLTSKVVSNYANTLAPTVFANTVSFTNTVSLTSPLAISSGGTGASSAVSALTNLLPTGTTSGYVLTTGGAGSYYWAAASGSSSTPGTAINTSRTYPTANAGQTLFATPTYTPGAGQLRVYINGVRQYATEYTETSNSSVTLTNSTSSGDVVMMEVDAYVSQPYYANNITYTVNSNISATANTIQLAIDGLVSKLVTYYANTSSPTVFANTVQTTSLGVGTPASGVSGEIRAANNITAYYSSDIRLKENIQDIQNAVDIVSTIGGQTFDWTDDYIQERGGEDGYFVVKQDFGVIAQTVESVFPLAVRKKDDGMLAVDYEKLCTLAFAAIKELKEEIEVLKGKIK